MPKVSEAYIEARREEILHAAITCFTRKGFHQTTMDDICRQAELSPGAVYRYFASKEEIIETAAQQGASVDFLGWVEEEIERFNDFVKLMDVFSDVGYRRYEHGETTEMAMKLRLRTWVEALQHPEVREEVLKRWENRMDITERIIRRAQEMGQINPDLDPGAVSRVMQALDDGFTLLWTIDPDFDIWQCRDVEMALYSGTFWCGKNGRAEQA